MFSVIFISLLLEALPFILIGSILSAILEVSVPQKTLLKFIPKNKLLAMSLAPFLGLIFPVCECVIVVIIRRLLKKGVPVHVAIPYMLSGTIINIVVIASTAFAFPNKWIVVVLRCAGGYVISLTVAYILYAMFKDGNDVLRGEEHKCGCAEHHHEHSHPHDAHCSCSGSHNSQGHEHEDRLTLFFDTLLKDFFYISKFLIFGVFIAAVINSSVPRSFLTGIGNNGLLANLTMIVMAFILSVCSEADAFVASSFTSFTVASKLAFLIRRMLDLKLTFMYLGLFKKKFALTLMLLIFISVFVLTSILSVFL